MALEDVVQGVKVNVSTDGVDDATSKIGQLDKAVGGLAKTAETATGAGGQGGVSGLGKAFQDLNRTGSEAFSQLLDQATHGELSGLATLLGGPVAGSVTKAAEQLAAFSHSQDEATINNAAMAKQFGTTPDLMAGISSAMGDAGVSTMGFERLVNRMSLNVARNYSSMMRGVRTENTSASETSLNLKKAQDDLAESFPKAANAAQEASLNVAKAHEKYLETLGVPKEVFAAQDKLREQQQAGLELDRAITAEHDADFKQQNEQSEKRIALDKAQEAASEQRLKSITQVTEALKQGSAAGQQQGLVGETDLQTLEKSVEHLAQGGGTKAATGKQVFDTLTELFRTGAIGQEQGIALLGTMTGQRAMGAGGAGMDAANIYGGAMTGMFTTQEQQRRAAVYQRQGIGPPTKEETAGIQQTEVERNKLAETSGHIAETINTKFLSPIMGTIYKGAARLEEVGINLANPGAGYDRAGPPSALSTYYGGAVGASAGAGIGGLLGLIATGFTGGLAAPLIPAGIAAGGLLGGVLGTAYGAGLGGPATPGATQPDTTQATPEGGVAARILGAGDAIVGALMSVSAAIVGVVFGNSSSGGPPPDNHGGVTYARGGAVRIPGYARGGVVRSNIPGFADGGPIGANPLVIKAMQKFGPQAMNLIKQYDPTTEAGRDKLQELVMGENASRLSEKGVAGAIEGAGAEVGEATLGTVAGVLSNPFGVGLLDASPTAAADYTSGAHTEEAAGRAMGASNAAEAAQMRAQGRDIPLWQGGFIRGFAEGGGIHIPGFAMGGDEISAAEEEVANAELAVQQHPKSKSAKDNLAFAKNKLAKLKAAEGADQRAEHNQDRARQGQERQQAAAEKQAAQQKAADQQDQQEIQRLHALDERKAAQQKAADQQDSLLNQKLGGTGWGDNKNMKSPGLMASPPSYNDPYAGIFGGANSPGAAVESPSGGISPPLAPEPELWQGGIPGFAMGSIKGPGSDTSDSILARLSNGEFVMKAAAVRSYGEGFMHAVNNMQIPPPKYERGGMVPASSLPHFAEGGPMERAGSTLNLHIGNESFNGMKAPAAVADQLRKYAVGQQTSATGKKPSWAGG